MEKQELLQKIYYKVKKQRQLYFKKTNQFRRLNSLSSVLIIGSGTIATTSLILSFSVIGVPLLLVSLVSSSVSTLSTALKRATRIQNKYEQFKTAYLSYSDIERELKLKLTMKLDDSEMNLIIGDINDRLSLVEINAPTVSRESISDTTRKPHARANVKPSPSLEKEKRSLVREGFHNSRE
jgi:hypothetical protein